MGGGCLCVFARFCDTFCDVLARAAEGPKANTRTGAGLCGLPPLPQEQGRGKDGVFGGLNEFSDIFLHGVCSPAD